MALPASGQIDMGQVNTELALAATTQRALDDTNVRALFGIASGAISLNDGHGKSNNTGGYWASGIIDSKLNPTPAYAGNWQALYNLAASVTNWKWVYGSAHSYSACGIKADGSMWTWGTNGSNARLGTGDTIDRATPVQIGVGKTWKQVKIGYPGALAIAEDGTLWGWGYILGQQNGTLYQNNPTPTQQGTNANWKQIALCQYGSSSTWLLTTDGTIFYIRSNVPQIDPGPGSGWAFIETDGIYVDRVFAIKTDGTLWTITPGYPPYYGCTATQVGTASNWKMISCGGYLYDNPDDPDTQYTRQYRFAIKTDGTLWGWGSNYGCELGLGSGYYDDSRPTPTQIGTATNWKVVCADMGSGGYSAGGCAIKTDGTLWGWGANYAPWSSGTGDTYSIPVQYGTDTNWKDVQHGSGYGAGYAFIKGV